jgi:DNA-binding MarR family transcriptional regulator
MTFHDTMPDMTSLPSQVEPDQGRQEAPAQVSDDSLEIASRLRMVIRWLHRLSRQFREGGLTPAQLSLLDTIEAFGPIRLGELADRESIAPSTLTRSVGWLITRGLAERQVVPGDRRATTVQVSAEGAKLLDTLRELRTAEFARRLRQLSAADLARIERAVPVLELLIDHQQRAPRCRPGAAALPAQAPRS